MNDPHKLIRLDDIRDIPDMAYPDIEPDAEPDSWEPINLAHLGPKPPQQPDLGGIGLVYPGERHVFSGPPESAKTLAAYAIALQVIRNGGHVVVIDFEMGRWQARDRLVELGYTAQELQHVHYVDPSEPATPERIQRLVVLKPQLVIIDAAAGAYDNLGLDDNKRADVEKFTTMYVRDFWRAQIATIVLDHVVKNLENRGNYVIGSERKLGGVFVHLGFATITPINRGGAGLYKITTHKDRGGWLQRGRVADFHLKSDPITHQITWEFKEAEQHDTDLPFRPTGLMEKVSRYLQMQTEPVSFTTVKASVQGEDKYIADALERLIEEDYAIETPGPRNARLVTHNELFTGQERPLRTPAAPLREGVQTTPARPYKGAGVAGVEDTTPADAGVEPKQRELEYDSDIPF